MYIYLDEKGYVYGYGSEYEENSFEVFSIPEEVDDFLGCYKYENREYILDENRKNYILSLKEAEREIDEIEEWFSWYDKQNSQYQRSLRLKKGFNKDMDSLDKLAEENAARIKKLRENLGGINADL